MEPAVVVAIVIGAGAIWVALKILGYLIGLATTFKAKQELDVAERVQRIERPAPDEDSEAVRQRNLCAQYGHAWITGKTTGETYCRGCGEDYPGE